MRGVVAAAMLVLGATSASANGFTVADLGGSSTRFDCIRKAELTARRFSDRFSGFDIFVGQWTTMLFDVSSSTTDFVIVCAASTTDYNRASLIVHGGAVDEREQVIDRVEEIWDSL
ncbi:MAG: hypothetical protein HLUCCA08_17805 [Rhodobacteraceae bacterium HLUCCA08]|nr:MAG: hypothetical protein HLUCCA08_17805 [Rhodobacteraceae bacterium HLUCCA08]